MSFILYEKNWLDTTSISDLITPAMEVGKIGSPISEGEVLERYGFKTREELNSKMNSLWLKYKK